MVIIFYCVCTKVIFNLMLTFFLCLADVSVFFIFRQAKQMLQSWYVHLILPLLMLLLFWFHEQFQWPKKLCLKLYSWEPLGNACKFSLSQGKARNQGKVLLNRLRSVYFLNKTKSTFSLKARAELKCAVPRWT